MKKLLSLVVFGLIGGACASPRSESVQFVQDVALPGSANRFDYQSLDPATGRLFIAHLAGDSVVVFDTQKCQVVKDIPDLARAHGVLWVPELNRLCVTATGTHELAIVEPEHWTVEARIPAGDYPDGLAYEPKTGRIFVSDEHGGASVVIDPHARAVVKTLEVGGDVGNTQYDARRRQVLLTSGETDELISLNPETIEVNWRMKLTGGEEAHGLLVHPELPFAYIACEKNDRLVATNLSSRKITGVYEVGGHPDVLSYDPGLHRLYVGCERDILSIFQVKADGSLQKLQDYKAPKAHSVQVDGRTHLLYLPLENLDGRPILRLLKPG